jgi:hypothetical protein
MSSWEDFIKRIATAGPYGAPPNMISTQVNQGVPLEKALENTKDFYRSVGQGLTIESNDEIEALVRTIFGDNTYGENVGQIRSEMDKFHEENPEASWIGYGSGIVPTLAVGAPSLVAKIGAKPTGALLGMFEGGMGARGTAPTSESFPGGDPLNPEFWASKPGGMAGGAVIGYLAIPAFEKIMDLTSYTGKKAGDVFNFFKSLKKKTDVGVDAAKRGTLKGIAATPFAVGAFSELPIGNIIQKIKVPNILPKSILAKSSAIINKRKLRSELGLDSRDIRMDSSTSNNLNNFFEGKFEPESLLEVGLRYRGGFLTDTAADAENAEFLFKNTADKNKYLELDKIRSNLKQKNDDFMKNGPGTWDQRLLSQTLEDGEKLERKAEVEMFKFIRDAYKGNRLKEDFFRTSGYIPKKDIITKDPMESAEYYYQNLKSAKNYFGKDYDNLRKLSTEDLEKLTNNNLTGTVDLERKALQKELMALPREVPTPKSLSDKFRANDAKREAYEDLKMLNKYDGEDPIRAKKAKPFIDYQKENDFTDDEMLDLLERSIEKAIKLEESMGNRVSLRTDLTDTLLDNE